ncbi:MAG: ribonuclease H [Candidatus Buchananbacteria bacterium CG10_big_fil_rev_8_21_14_0_10_42_9]|uniref:Ribonuclease H n=1 Tax=Candidatus Buchananbacteria bacterium CG10_big_fil_rev_8_21_14_0_10_42_9 TaxID=1974526 RepID=A0A2H0W257_9BACT|nr:MAG: ribonuclease H [Candidatus Buchananbacteria bacterium CG10_big_fil_rev_8_21_14_0_10_42_9]
MARATLFCDGGARGNPGPAGAGAVLKYNGKTYEMKEYLGEATNNQAEYRALIMGLRKAVEVGVQELDCYLDSELLVEQMNQRYKVKNQGLAVLFVRAWNLAAQLKKVTYRHVYRNQNQDADRLVNEAIDENI